ncbi:MAG TPA: response regulator [Methylomirabilota bacterium]|jgi:DNA-binding response OmpR family regulator
MDPILLVDDEADLLSTYERLLRRSGYRVVSAGSCRDGLLMVAREPLALVVTDLRLPDGDGLDIVRAARRTSPKPTPALVVTGFASEASRTASLAAGASGYLAKPFGAAALVALIEGTLGARPDL